ncbi:MAG: DUF6352 family protein [Proteobacteria bacterium]|nr:DUF6352 family protein [Pseudomonadota bacterium]
MTGCDFWVASGHHLLDRADGGGLVVTDTFLKAYLARPELVPPDEACPVERGLHQALLDHPRLAVSVEEIGHIADEDARENFTLFLAFRDRLLAHPTLEAAYRALVTQRIAGLPPLFLQQLTHVIARNAFDGVDDPFVLRAAECLFRTQKVTFHEGALLLADAEAIALHEHTRAHSPLMAMLGGPAVSELDVLNETNAGDYAGRSDAHDFVFNLGQGTRGRAALGAAAQRWIAHLTGVDIAFEPVERLRGENVAWFLPFDAAATQIGNRVWNGESLDAASEAQILALYRFRLPESAAIEGRYRGRQALAIAAVQGDNLFVLKAQNLIAGLPFVPGAN